jgi:D-alanyl-D-alanine carboxypeptidase
MTLESTRETLEKIREKYHLPALAATTVVGGKPSEVFAVGTRKFGGSEPVETTDAFHLGSDTKAMTATLIGILIDQKKLTASTTLGQLFPELIPKTVPAWKAVTIEQLLEHRAGLTQLEPAGKDLLYLHRLPSPLRKARERYLKERLVTPPDKTLGTFSYSNAGYTILGMVAERLLNADFETLLTKHVFEPLGITGSGFGAPPQVVQHKEGTPPEPVPRGPLADNPPVMAAAGRAYMPLGDWARFIAAHATEDTRLLTTTTWEYLHTPATKDSTYMGGWICVPRSWARGLALTHAGSNTMNFCNTWLAPKRGLAVLVATNVAGEDAQKACDEVIGLLLPPLAK